MEFESLLLTAVSIIVGVAFVVMTIVAAVLIAAWQIVKKGEPDSSEFSETLSRIIPPQFHVDFKVFLVITPFYLLGIFWVLLISDFLRIEMILCFLMWIQLIISLYLIKRLGSNGVHLHEVSTLEVKRI